MAFGAVVVGHYSVLPGRPRPASLISIIAFLSCGGWCLCPRFFSQPSDGGARGGGGDGDDAEALLVPTKANSPKAAEGIHSNGNKNDEIEKIELQLTTILNFLASFDNHLTTIVNFRASLRDHLTTVLNILASMENCIATNRDTTTAPLVSDTPANEDAENRKMGFLGSIYAITEKLLMFCGTLFLGLLSYSVPKAGQNFEDPWMQAIITGSIILFFNSFILLPLASNLKESKSIDGVLFKIFKWLLLPVLLTLWPGLCTIVHFFAHTSNIVLWPLGTLCSVLSVSAWVWAFYKEQPKILEELKKSGVLKNGMLLEKPESEAASAPGSDGTNSYTVEISGDALSK